MVCYATADNQNTLNGLLWQNGRLMRGGWGRSVIWESHGLRPMKNDNACSLNGQIFEDEDSLQNATESKTNYNPVFEGVISP